MKTLTIKMECTMQVPNNFKLEKLTDPLNDETEVIKVGKKCARPFMLFMNWKKDKDGYPVGTQDDELTDVMFNHSLTEDISYKLV